MEIVKIAGFDPGLRFCGYAIINYNTETKEQWIDHCGLIATPTSIKALDAICYMRDNLFRVCERECFNECDQIVIELPAAIYSKSFSAGGLLPTAIIGGCIMALCDPLKSIPVYPAMWTKNKKKEATRAAIDAEFGGVENWQFDDPPKKETQCEHIYDAIGMAWWYLKNRYIDE